jgi:hypothetical protein
MLSFLVLFFLLRLSPCILGWPQTHYAAQVGFKFTILLPQSHECWDCKLVPLTRPGTDLKYFPKQYFKKLNNFHLNVNVIIYLTIFHLLNR